MKNVNNKKILVIGAARSGTAVAKLLQRKGADVFVTDNSTIKEPFRSQLQQAGIPFEEKGHTVQAGHFECAVLSPGVATQTPLVQQYLEEGKAVYSEIEVASWFNQSPLLAITGSNGKTTVTSWMNHTWGLAGKKHVTTGNIGNAFSENVAETSPDKDCLIEVSSFQLDHIDTFHPNVSLLLNITADHLDRYDNDFEKYAAAKFRIMKNQTKNDWIIYNRDDPVIHQKVQSIRKKKDATDTRFFINKGSTRRRLY